MICQYCGKSYQEVTDTRPSYTCYSCNREFVSVHPSVLDKFEAELKNKDAEIERLSLAMRNKEQTASTMWHNQQIELQSLRSKMDKAQTRTMHKDKYGNLSVYVGHDLEGSETVEVLLMEVEESK